MIDGVVVTTTTSKVIYGDEDKQLKDDHVLRYVSIVMSVFKYNLFLLIVISKSYDIKLANNLNLSAI